MKDNQVKRRVPLASEVNSNALIEQARSLVDELHTERLSYDEYCLLRDAIDSIDARLADDICHITVNSMVSFLESKGWVKDTKFKNKNQIVFRQDELSLALPAKEEFDDYQRGVEVVINYLSVYLSTSPRAIIREMLGIAQAGTLEDKATMDNKGLQNEIIDIVKLHANCTSFRAAECADAIIKLLADRSLILCVES